MRFRFPEKYAMRVVNKAGSKVLAYFTIIDNEIGIEFRDVRLMKGSKGNFVAAPFRDYEKDGQKKYADFWRPAWNEEAEERDERGVAYVEEMLRAAQELYDSISSGEGTEDAPRRSASKTGGKKSARGPVAKRPAPKVEEDDTEDGEQFPF